MSWVVGFCIRIYNEEQPSTNQPEFDTVHSAYNRVRFDSILFIKGDQYSCIILQILIILEQLRENNNFMTLCERKLTQFLCSSSMRKLYFLSTFVVILLICSFLGRFKYKIAKNFRQKQVFKGKMIIKLTESSVILLS